MKISTFIEKMPRLPEKNLEKNNQKVPKCINRKKLVLKKIPTFILFKYCHGLLRLFHYYGTADGNHRESSF